MKLKRPELILTFIGVLLLLAAVFSYLRNQREKGSEEVGNFPKKIHGGPCPGETKTLTNNDPYMRGIVEKGQEYKVIMNYYDCNPLKDGDLVLYSLSQNLDPVVKIVRGVGGDHFKLSKDKKRGAWNLLINDEMIMTETDHTPYFFGGDMPATLSLYEKSHKGVLHGDEMILLSSWAPGDSDSGMFGVFNVVDIVGKVEVGKSGAVETEAKAPAANTAQNKPADSRKGKAPEVKPGIPVKTNPAPQATPKKKNVKTESKNSP